ncbi:MAG: hypothetical protein ACI88H_003043 [Cocleimonas sp.]
MFVVLAIYYDGKPQERGGVFIMGNINRTYYHELNFLLWDIHCKFIKPEVAFQLYEQRWRYVDENQLTQKEKTLIKKLTDIFGNGLFMPAC